MLVGDGEVVGDAEGAADGAGVYSFDLRSATGRVKRGAPVAAYVDPVCDVWVQVGIPG